MTRKPNSSNRNSSPDTDLPVLVIGGAAIDVIGRLQGGFISGTSNPAHIRSSYGGVARNVSENLARLGQQVTFLTAVGLDYPGDQIIQQCDLAGIDISHVYRSPSNPSGLYLAVLDEVGKLIFALDDMRVTAEISAEYIQSKATLFKQASMLFLDTNLPRDAIRKAISLAIRAKITICADPTSNSLAIKLIPHLSRLHLITPNNYEAGVLCGRTIEIGKRRQAISAAKYLIAQGVEIAIVTLAEQGVCYATSETSGFIPAIRAEIIDPTGAGDALTATVIYALLHDISLDDALRLAVSAATLTLNHPGSVVPDLSLEKLYDQLVI